MKRLDREKLQQLFVDYPVLTETESYFLIGVEVAIPWLILVAKTEPNQENEKQLFFEALKIKNRLISLYPNSNFNLAKLGNKTPVFHIHIIMRSKEDELWPEPVWCKEEQLQKDIGEIQKIIPLFRN